MRVQGDNIRVEEYCPQVYHIGASNGRMARHNSSRDREDAVMTLAREPTPEGMEAEVERVIVIQGPGRINQRGNITVENYEVIHSPYRGVDTKNLQAGIIKKYYRAEGKQLHKEFEVKVEE